MYLLGRIRSNNFTKAENKSVTSPQKIEQWRVEYNEYRPHSSLIGLTPSKMEEKEKKFDAEFSNLTMS
jgi:outer membrane biogenesis lipoprotein LolB